MNIKKIELIFLSKLSENLLYFLIKVRKNSLKKSLEVGAGTLNHITYENMNNKKHDIIEPKIFL